MREVGALEKALADQFRKALTHPDLARQRYGNKLCGGFQPGVALRFVSGTEEATVLLCFACGDIKVVGKSNFEFDMGGARTELLRLSSHAFPDDEALSSLLRERTERATRQERFEATVGPVVLPLLLPPTFIEATVALRSRDLKTGRLTSRASTAAIEQERASALLVALEAPALARLILKGLGVQDLDWDESDFAARVLVAAATELGPRRMTSVFRELEGDADAAAGAARLFLWEGMQLEDGDTSELVARIDRAAADNSSKSTTRPRSHCSPLRAILALVRF